MSVVPFGGARGLLPPAVAHRRIELHRQLGADPDAVMEEIRAHLDARGCACRLVAPRTLAFDGASFEGFLTYPVRAATVTLDLSNPARAAFRLDAQMDALQAYGWVVIACLALAFVHDLPLRVLGWAIMAVVGVLSRAQPLDAIEGAVLEAVRHATGAARLPASTT